jgi:hypothetical protein
VLKNVIVVDNFYPDPDAVRERAIRSDYANIKNTDYPGFASRLILNSNALERRFSELVGAPLNVDRQRFTWGGFRYITEDSGSSPIVHADEAADWAAMVYLTPNAPMQAGTGLYEHKASGRWGPPTDREARKLGFADASEFEDAVIQPDKADLSKWREVARIAPVYNRLVLFRGSTVYHAPIAGCGSGPHDARLTHIFFFNELADPGNALVRRWSETAVAV